MVTEENSSSKESGGVSRTIAADFSERIAVERAKNRIIGKLGPLIVFIVLAIVDVSLRARLLHVD